MVAFRSDRTMAIGRTLPDDKRNQRIQAEFSAFVAHQFGGVGLANAELFGCFGLRPTLTPAMKKAGKPGLLCISVAIARRG